MPDQREPNEKHDPFVTMPKEWDKGAGVDPGHAIAFGHAIESFLEDGMPPTPHSVVPGADLADVIAQEPSLAEPAAENTDPRHPGAEVWHALEQEIEKEENEIFHRPVAPEELPDISNL
jgi:hypothetical protein